MRILLDRINTDYGQFDLVWSEDAGLDFDRVFAGQGNGVAGAAHPDGLYLSLGRRWGGSQVRIEHCDDEPALSEDWEDVAEVSLKVDGPGAGWMTWAGEDGGSLDVAVQLSSTAQAKPPAPPSPITLSTRRWRSSNGTL